jgi:glycosyltransferase involved in cell wall biosynthesis
LEPSYFASVVAPIPDEPRMVCVGRLSPEKGQLLMVQAAGAVAAGGVAMDVILAGDGPLRKDIEREIAHRALKDVVHLAGWVDNRQVRELLLQSRALVVSSFAEGLPVVIMEAFALRRPVIATAIAGIPELVKDGLNGWLITAGDVASLTRAMQEAATETPSRLAAMGEAGHKLVFEQHNTAIEAEKLKTLFLASLLASLAAA